MDEIELKLQLTPDGADALVSSGILTGDPEAVPQSTTYFDTPDHALAAAGLSLRIRRLPDRRVQTVKAAGAGAAGLFARSEWEKLVEHDAPVIDDTTPVGALLNGDAARLSPAFSVEVTRRTWMVEQDGALVEVVLDRGEARVGDRLSPICEMELELKSGPSAALFALARRLEDIAPARIGVLTKAERGYRLTAERDARHKAEDVALTPDMTADAAFAQIVQSCLRQFRLNEDIILEDRRAEALHQARVSLRRLRSAFTIFKPMLDGAGLHLKDDLRWLAGELGDARDLDVLLLRAPAGALHQKLQSARERAYDRATGALESHRARVLMLDLVEFVTGLPDHAELAPDFAATALARFRRKVKKDGRDLAGLDDEDRHEVRKDAKKLRYAADFFASLFGDEAKKHKRFVAALSDMQDELGALNDLASAPEVLRKHGVDDDPDAYMLLEGGRKKRMLTSAEKSWRKLVDAKPFWT